MGRFRVQRIDALDAFQLTKALYAVSLLIAWGAGFPDATLYQVRAVLTSDLRAPFVIWIGILCVYTIAASSCFVWRNRAFQTGFSFFSLWMWSFNGMVTLLFQDGSASGVFQLLLALVSLAALYFRGKMARR